MKNLKRLAAFAPMVSAVILTGFVVVSLMDYEIPVYAVWAPKTVTEGEGEEKTQQSAEPDTEKTKDTKNPTKTVAVNTNEPNSSTADTSGEDNVTIDISNQADGVYEGVGTGFAGKIKVSVEIKDKKIIAIQIISVEADDASFVERAKGVIDKIIAAQSVDVDTVSGATYSSRGIIRAVKNALTGETDDGQAVSAPGSMGTGMGAASLPPVKDAAAYKDGVYEGSGIGFAGEIKVKVTISKGKITKIEITRIADGTEYVQKASAVIQSILQKQSTNVDTVSGATYSSVGIISAVRDALSKAATDGTETSETEESTEKTGNFAYNDGVYYGTAAGFSGDITVAVVLQEKTIKAILITESSDDESYLNRAKTVADQIIKKQSTKADTVSGATYSSKGIRQAVINALKQAKNITEGKEPDTGTGQEESVTGTIPYDEGVYYGTGNGFQGEIEVAVAIADKTMKAIVVTKSEDDAEFFNRARAVIDSVVKKQSVEVDTVSGATFSSNGILEAIINALSEAKKVTEGAGDAEEPTNTETAGIETVNTETAGIETVNTEAPGGSTESGRIPANTENSGGTENTESTENGGSVYQDGTYMVSVICYPDENEDFISYNLSAAVTIKDDKIVSISSITGDGSSENDAFIKRAAAGTNKKAGVVTQIVEKGNTEGIDAVSAATCSSAAIIDACNQALIKALK